MNMEDKKIAILPLCRPRQEWGDKFRLMAEGGDDWIIHGNWGAQTEWDEDEWEWQRGT